MIPDRPRNTAQQPADPTPARRCRTGRPGPRLGRRLLAAAAVVLATLARSAPGAAWPTFHGNNARRGVSDVSFTAPPAHLLWTFDLGSHTWTYCQGASIWSSCAVSAEVDGHMRVFVGSYDHNVYCLEAATGQEIWRFTTGCLIKAAPTVAMIDGTPMVFVAASDRSIYGLDARTGRKLWQFETYNWTYTVGESLAGAPLVANINGRPRLFCTMWNTDRRPLRTVQRGELLSLEPDTGDLIWRVQVSSTFLTTPSFMLCHGEPRIYVGSDDGTVYARDAVTGEHVWKYITGHRIAATPMLATIAHQPLVFIANGFGMVRCLSAVNGAHIWRYKSGHEVLSTPALFTAGRKLLLAFGSGDRCVHALDAKSGEPVWTFQTGKYVVASPAVAAINGQPVLFVNSLDNYLYAIDGDSGREILRFACGDMLWPYETRGASLWSSPSLTRLGDGRGLVLYPGHDGKLYALTASVPDTPAAAATVSSWSTPAATRDDDMAASPPARADLSPSLVLIPVAGVVLMLAGLVLLLTGYEAESER